VWCGAANPRSRSSRASQERDSGCFFFLFCFSGFATGLALAQLPTPGQYTGGAGDFQLPPEGGPASTRLLRSARPSVDPMPARKNLDWIVVSFGAGELRDCHCGGNWADSFNEGKWGWGLDGPPSCPATVPGRGGSMR